MIDTLTPEQIAKFPEYVEKYTALGTATDRIKRTDAKHAVEGIYKLLNHPVQGFEILEGPRAAWDRVCELCFKGEKKPFQFPSYLGNLDAGFIAAVDFFEKELKIMAPEIYRHYRHALRVHLVWPLDGRCIVCDKPEICDFRGQVLHNESGPAIAYADDTKIWVIDGTSVDETIVMRPQEQTIQEINADTNADRRTIRIERYGWPRYLHGIGATCIDEGENVVEGTYETLFDAGEFGNRFVATCVTGRIVSMGVPPDVRTREIAQKWLASNREVNVIART